MFYKVVADEEEVKWFWHYGMPNLESNEVHFLSVSYRNKVLSEKEREEIGLGRSEMIDKKVIRHDSYKMFLESLYSLEFNIEGSKTKINKSRPQKARRIYVNITPVNAYSSSQDLVQEVLKAHEALTNSALKGSKEAIDESWHKIRKLFDSTQSIFARNFSKHRWIDIDIDCDHVNDSKSVIDSELEFLNSKLGKGNVMLVKTSGGYHFLIRRSELKEDPSDFVRHITDSFLKLFNNNIFKECIINKNHMIPCPGTFIGENFVCSVINKNDFSVEQKFWHKDDIYLG